jgi:hypothetical protein
VSKNQHLQATNGTQSVLTGIPARDYWFLVPRIIK